MAIDSATKKLFNERIAEEKSKISEFEKEISALKKAIISNKKLKSFFHLGSAAQQIQIINLQIEMSNISEQMLQVKNNSYLDNARKIIYKVFAEIENVVRGEVDEPIDFNRDELDKIAPFTPKQRLNLYKHLRTLIERLIAAYGQNTKWIWSFPELYSKSAILGMNMVDFREVQAKRDPREEFFYDRKEMTEMLKEDLFDASNRYRDKFEISTKSTNDMVMAIRLLEALKRVAAATKDDAVGAKAKTGIDSYKARLEADKEEKKGGAKPVPAKKK